jgi:hypothetical protein
MAVAIGYYLGVAHVGGEFLQSAFTAAGIVREAPTGICPLAPIGNCLATAKAIT